MTFDKLLLKIVEEEKVEYFLKLNEEIVGSPLYEFISTYLKKYNEFPPLEECYKYTEERNAEAPFEYYWEQYENEKIALRISEIDFIKINSLLEKGKAKEAAQILRSYIERIDEDVVPVKYKTLSELIDDFKEYISEPPAKPDGLLGITTGWPTLDRVTQGLQAGDLGLVTGRVKMGKTMALLHMIKSAHLDGAKVMVVSMEMTLQQVARRMFAMYAGVAYEPIKTRRLSTIAKKYLTTILEGMKKELPPAYFVEGSFVLNLSQLRGAVMAIKPDVLFIDGAYLIKIPYSRRKATWEVAKEVADGLKAISLSAGIPIVAAFQLTREVTKRKSESVGLEHIHLTDALSANCSWAIGIFEAPGDPTKRLIRILGAREGESDDFLINYDWERMDFSEVKDTLEEVEYDEDTI